MVVDLSCRCIDLLMLSGCGAEAAVTDEFVSDVERYTLSLGTFRTS